MSMKHMWRISLEKEIKKEYLANIINSRKEGVGITQL